MIENQDHHNNRNMRGIKRFSQLYYYQLHNHTIVQFIVFGNISINIAKGEKKIFNQHYYMNQY